MLALNCCFRVGGGEFLVSLLLGLKFDVCVLVAFGCCGFVVYVLVCCCLCLRFVLFCWMWSVGELVVVRRLWLMFNC